MKKTFLRDALRCPLGWHYDDFGDSVNRFSADKGFAKRPLVFQIAGEHVRSRGKRCGNLLQ